VLNVSEDLPSLSPGSFPLMRVPAPPSSPTLVYLEFVYIYCMCVHTHTRMREREREIPVSVC
jgi:hypothetical protein